MAIKLARKADFLYKIRGNPGEIWFWGLRASGGAISIKQIEKRVGKKLRRVILLRFGFGTFGFHFGKTRKPFIFMVFGFWDVSMTPKTNYF